MEAQLWIIREMKERSWKEFHERHGGKQGEAALLRVAGYYNRVGTLIRLRLVDAHILLRTTGWTAYLVWRKIEPLLKEARRENPEFLTDFERIIPLCKSCIGDPRARRLRRLPIEIQFIGGSMAKKLKDVMTANPTCCVASDTVQHAAKLMIERDAGSIPAISDQESRKLEGMITDICCTVVAEGRDPKTATVGDHMTRKVVSCGADDDLDSCAQAMQGEPDSTGARR